MKGETGLIQGSFDTINNDVVRCGGENVVVKDH